MLLPYQPLSLGCRHGVFNILSQFKKVSCYLLPDLCLCQKRDLRIYKKGECYCNFLSYSLSMSIMNEKNRNFPKSPPPPYSAPPPKKGKKNRKKKEKKKRKKTKKLLRSGPMKLDRSGSKVNHVHRPISKEVVHVLYLSQSY